MPALFSSSSRFVWFLALLGVLATCLVSQGQEAPPSSPPKLVPAGSLEKERTDYQVAVYYPERPKTDPLAWLQKELSAKYPDYLIRQKVGEGQVLVIADLLKDVAEDYPVLTPMLNYSAVTEKEAKLIAGSQEVFVMTFGMVEPDMAKRVQRISEINRLASDLATNTGGYLWDEETRDFFSTKTWNEQRLFQPSKLPPNVVPQIETHGYRNPDLIRIITLGMKKFGLPDISLENIPVNSSRAAEKLVFLAAQKLFESPQLMREGRLNLRADEIKSAELVNSFSFYDNAKKETDLWLWQVGPDEGDPENRIIRLTASPQFGNGEIEALEAALTNLFGSEGRVSYIQHNQELEAASKAAQAKLPALRTRFQAKLKPNESLLVKAPFKVHGPDGGREWMWVEVLEWDGEEINGILLNDPRAIPNLKAGANVQVRMQDIFDYLLKLSDGKTEGDETSKIIEKMQSAR